jgi:arylamine N-acetyltransferase
MDQGRHLVDLGNGSPFFEPVPLDGPFEVRRAGLAFRFHADADAAFQERWIDGAWQTFCRYELAPTDEALRQAAYQRHHTRGQSWVVDSLVLVRCEPDVVWTLRNDEFRAFRSDGKSVERVSEPAAYRRLAAEVFGLPGLPIEAARRALQQGLGARG